MIFHVAPGRFLCRTRQRCRARPRVLQQPCTSRTQTLALMLISPGPFVWFFFVCSPCLRLSLRDGFGFVAAEARRLPSDSFRKPTHKNLNQANNRHGRHVDPLSLSFTQAANGKHDPHDSTKGLQLPEELINIETLSQIYLTSIRCANREQKKADESRMAATSTLHAGQGSSEPLCLPLSPRYTWNDSTLFTAFWRDAPPSTDSRRLHRQPADQSRRP